MSRTRLNHIAPLMGNPEDYTAQITTSNTAAAITLTLDPPHHPSEGYEVEVRPNSTQIKLVDITESVWLDEHGRPVLPPTLPHNRAEPARHIGARGGHQRTATNPVHVRA